MKRSRQLTSKDCLNILDAYDKMIYTHAELAQYCGVSKINVDKLVKVYRTNPDLRAELSAKELQLKDCESLVLDFLK